ncbi:hypothetical protein [Aquimarina brevivitae]|uniref:Lipoprotein n=1 Tax=Aquimarina brevivitae TaxID=323412 RepID=A0A4Q7PJM7_9FLAO|nr:hypothetical protein [Aquimarina brevivitae]RZS99112.1 hypothetical protein EV197_0317 [Aquimarina brevivitae]
MKSFLFLISSLLLLVSCKQEQQQSTNTALQTIKPLDSLSKKTAGTKLKTLSPESKKKVGSFDDYQSFEDLMITLESANPYYIQKYADSIDILISTVRENLSEDLKTKPIEARLKLLVTESGLLKDIAKENKPKATELLKANTKLILAYNSLAIQLNELTLAIPEDIEKELLRTTKNLRDSTQILKDEN